jgi:polysaccharide pyruvyl transferase WcaK-like protein
MVVGGGDLLRTDDETLASHYGPGPSVDRMHLIASRFPRESGAFFRFPSRGPAISRVAFFSIGVPHRFSAEEYPLVRMAMSEAAYIYVRDERSRSRLLEAGVNEEIIVAPDAVVMLDDIFPRETLAESFDAVLARHNLLPAAPYLCFQISAASVPEIPLIAPQLSYVSTRRGLRVLLLPLGFCHGDREALSALASLEPARFTLIQPRTIMEMLAVIAHAVVFCGVSMHGNLAAFVYKVRSLFGKIDVSKIDGVMDLLGLPPDLHLQHWLDLRSGLELALARDCHDLEEKHETAKAQAHASCGHLIASLQQ